MALKTTQGVIPGVIPKSHRSVQRIETASGDVIFRADAVTCWCGITGFCDHVELYVRNNLDELGKVLNGSLSGLFSVPLVPRYDLWVDVDFEKIGDEAYVLEVSDEAVVRAGVDRFLGVIGLTEGRMIVRNMVDAWFVKYQHDGITSCQSGVHGWREAKALEANAGDTSYDFTNRWSLRWTKSCRPCNLKGVANWDDLVPDQGPKPTWGNL